ncbi:MAG: right-handed parallel beta-helix repeat-containing protein [Sandaracinaceae bacterium]
MLVLSSGCPSREACADGDFRCERPEGAGWPARVPWLEEGSPPIASPDLPWLEGGDPPVAWACPDGWRPVVEGGVRTCDPYPADGALACPDGEAHFPGEADCAAIGRTCPEGRFPDLVDVPPDTPRLFVLASAGAEGNGSESSPFPTLAGALDAAGAGVLLVLGAGTYEVDRAWPDGVSVRGLCTRASSLTAAALRPAVLDVSRHDSPIRVENVSVGPAPTVGVRVRRPGAAVTLDGVRVRRVVGDPAAIEVASGARVQARSLVVRDTQARLAEYDGLGVRVHARGRLDLRRAILDRNLGLGLLLQDEGSSATVEDLVVRETLPRAVEGVFGRGLDVGLGARLELRRALFERNHDVAVLLYGGGEAAVEDLIVRDTQPRQRDGTVGDGIVLQESARLVLRRGLLERNRRYGVFVYGEGTEAGVEDLVVRDTLPEEGSGRLGRGIEVESGARLNLLRALLSGNHDAGAILATGAEAELEDLVVRDTRPLTDGSGGWGFGAQFGVRVAVRRAVVERNHDAGMLIGGDGTSAVLEDLVVRETRARSRDGEGGRGLNVQFDARVELRRGLFEGNRDAGVIVVGAYVHAVLEDIAVRGTLPRRSDGAFGRGLGVQDGAVGELRRALLEGNHETGVLVSGEGALAMVDDVVVRDTLATDVSGGRGLSVQRGARMELRRGLVESNREIGVLAAERSILDAEEVVVRLTQGPTCAPECTDQPPGVSLASVLGASAEVRRFELASGEVCGVQIASGGRARLSDGVVRDHPIAVCLQDDFPLELLREDVAYVNNEVLVDSRSFAIPDLAEAIAPVDPGG